MKGDKQTTTQLRAAIFILLGIIFTGTGGYVIIENWPLFDAFYMTIISITTTGYKEIRDLSTPGRLFTIFIISSGVITLAYIAGKAAQYLIRFYITQRKK